jgi:hypothetical protein
MEFSTLNGVVGDKSQYRSKPPILAKEKRKLADNASLENSP